ncbi:MAG: histidine phosphatase family protein [bacterium]
MFKETVPKIESDNKYGKDIEMKVIFVRHGEKDKVGESLSPSGKEQAVKFGETLDKKDAIKGYTSPIQRALETVENIIESAPHDKKLNLRKKISLKIPPFSEEQTLKFRQSVKDGKDPAEWYLRYRDQRPDAETAAPREVAEGLAYMLDHYCKMCDKLYSGSKVDLINGTHSVVPETLLQEILIREVDGKKVVGFENVSEIGGSLKYVEPIEFSIKTDNLGQRKIEVNFRGQRYDIDEERLTELVESYKEKRRAEKKE